MRHLATLFDEASAYPLDPLAHGQGGWWPFRESSTNLCCHLESHSALQTAKMGIKGTPAPTKHDGSQLRIGIVHARWNLPIIQALLDGALHKLRELGVKEENIVVQAVPGSFELPFACSK